MQYSISILATNGDYEFIIDGNENTPDQITKALADGIAVFEDINGDTIMINGNNIMGCVISVKEQEDS